jgi:hypothetical protein
MSNERMISLNHQNSNLITNNEGQLQSATLALKELNTILPQDRQIKLLLFLYSKFSQKSDMLINALPQECRKFFYYICIDNKSIREKIVNSTTIKISEVPCILLIDINDSISTYEGDRSVDIIKTIHGLNSKYNTSKQPPSQPQSQQQSFQKSASSSVTQLTDILDDTPQEEYPEESKRPPRRSPIPDRMPVPKNEDDDDMSSLVEDNNTNMNGVRKKVRHANRPVDHPIPEQERPDVGLSSARNFPTKGLGHENMGQSSLSQIPSQPPQKRSQNMNVSGGEMLDDELDEMLNEDSTMDPQIKKAKGGSMDKKEALANVKKAAMEMMEMRKAELEKEENNN